MPFKRVTIILIYHSNLWNNLLCFYFRSNGRPKTPVSLYHIVRVQSKVNKYGSWVPYELSANNKVQRVSTCASLLSWLNCEPFLERIVTEDEKWVCYVNVSLKRQQLDPGGKPLPEPKANLHLKKMLLCIWWNMKGVLYFELLDNNQNITTEVYAQQQQRLQEILLKKRPAQVNRKVVIVLHDNTQTTRREDDPEKNPRAEMESSCGSTILAGPCAIRLPSVPLSSNPPEWETLRRLRHTPFRPRRYFCLKID